MKFERKHKIEPNFNYASLTDIVLQLLIFFMLTSSFVSMTGVKVALPKAQSGEMNSDRQTIVTLTAGGRLFLNAEEVTTETLGQKLIPILDRNQNQIIIIKADKEVNLQKAVEVIDLAKGVGAQKFMIATEPENGE